MAVYNFIKLTLGSITEGLLYLGAGSLLYKLNKVNTVYVFTIGFILHILFEIIGIHESFLKNRCTLN